MQGEVHPDYKAFFVFDDPTSATAKESFDWSFTFWVWRSVKINGPANDINGMLLFVPKSWNIPLHFCFHIFFHIMEPLHVLKKNSVAGPPFLWTNFKHTRLIGLIASESREALCLISMINCFVPFHPVSFLIQSQVTHRSHLNAHCSDSALL